jgi:hypothetical protein
LKYFSYFPKIEYGDELATNIMVRAKVRDILKQNASLFYNYRLSEGDRPDLLSDFFYGSSDYTWLIFYANDMYDPNHDWPLFNHQFLSYMEEKYGDGKVLVSNSANIFFLKEDQSLNSNNSEEIDILKKLKKGQFIQIRNTDNTLINGVFMVKGFTSSTNNIKVFLSPANTIDVSYTDYFENQDPNQNGGFVTVEYEQAQRVVKHFRYINNLIIDKQTYSELPFNLKKVQSVWEWEEAINDSKRTIKLIDSVHLGKILNEIKDMF